MHSRYSRIAGVAGTVSIAGTEDTEAQKAS
jgi:hypothetical protein